MGRKTAVVAMVVLIGCDGGGNGGASDGGPESADAEAVDGARSPGPFSEACGFTGPAGRSVRMLTANNGAELEGPVLGSPDVIHAELRRPVTVTNVRMGGPFVVGTSFITRDDDQGDSSTVFVSVTSSDPTPSCLIKANAIRWLDAAGAELARDDLTFLVGSVGDLGMGYSDTCLGPGEVGYFISAYPRRAGKDNLFSAVTSVELSIDGARTGFPVRASLMPTAYVRCGRSKLFEVSLENRGQEPAAIWIDLVGQYIFADATGPLTWGFLNPRGGLGVYGPGKTMLVGAADYYQGAAPRLFVYSSFDSPTSFATPLSPDLELLVNDARNDRARLARLWRARAPK